MSLHLDTIPNRKSRPTILLREAWREGDRIIKKTLCNLTHLPPHIVEGIRAMLKGGVVYRDIKESFPIKRSLPHGHVACVYGMAKKPGLDRMLHRKSLRVRDIALGAIVMRVISPGSKLAASRGLSVETRNTSIGTILVDFTNTPVVIDQCTVLLNEVRSKISRQAARPEGRIIVFTG